MIIRVKKKHIKNVYPSSNECPVALAIKEQTGKDRVLVGSSIIIGLLRCKVPRSVARFINNFDEGRSVKPFNFKLEYRV